MLDKAGSTDLLDAATPATAYAVHASPGAGNVDILADANATPVDDAIPLAVDVPSGACCSIDAVPAPAGYVINVTPTGDPTPVMPIPFDAEQAGESTAIVTGFALSQPVLQPIGLSPERSSSSKTADREPTYSTYHR